MTTRFLTPAGSVDIDGEVLVPRDYELTLDAGSVPYAVGTVELPFLDDTALDFLDPRGDVRVPVSVGDGGTPRVFDLGLRERAVDHDAKTVKLQLAGDEAMLQDYAPLADDAEPLALQASLRDVCDYVLDLAIPGASLEAGDDADVTAFWPVTNLHPNPLPASATGYNIAANGTALTFTTLSGQNVIRWTSSGTTSNLNAGTTSAYRASPGKKYFAAWDWASASSGRSAALVMEFRSSNGTVLMSRTTGSTASYAAVFQTLTVEATAPAGTETVYVYITTTGNSVATMHYATEVVIAETDFPVPFFYGGSSDADYTYAWTDVTSASPSTRVPVVERLPEALIIRAGQTAWDFLMALCATVGMVLWCDEQRNWYLQTPEDRTIPDLLNVSGANTREGVDTLSREDTDTYVTGVVCRYKWTGADGIAREQIDAAGTPAKVLVVEFDRPYPGAGTAATMLARRTGTGREQEVTAITRWDATPGMTASITLPGAPETTGRIASVTFHPDGFMDLGMSGLIDLIPGSIAALAGTIDALSGTIDSL